MDWVQAYLDCQPRAAFEALRARLKSDFQQWQETRVGSPSQSVQFDESREDTVGITLAIERYLNLYIWSTASLRGNKIEIRILLEPSDSEQSVQTYTVTPKVNAKGECRLLFGSQEQELWQISRMMLSHILFR